MRTTKTPNADTFYAMRKDPTFPKPSREITVYNNKKLERSLKLFRCFSCGLCVVFGYLIIPETASL